MKEGWICPRCNRVNAPFTPYCDCNNMNTNIANRVCANGMHEWECISVDGTAGHTYRCKVCREIKKSHEATINPSINIFSNFNKGGEE